VVIWWEFFKLLFGGSSAQNAYVSQHCVAGSYFQIGHEQYYGPKFVEVMKFMAVMNFMTRIKLDNQE